MKESNKLQVDGIGKQTFDIFKNELIGLCSRAKSKVQQNDETRDNIINVHFYYHLK